MSFKILDNLQVTTNPRVELNLSSLINKDFCSWQHTLPTSTSYFMFIFHELNWWIDLLNRSNNTIYRCKS